MSKLSQFMGGGGGGGFGGLETVIASEDMTVESNTSVGINTSNAEVSVTLPANPDVGDRITFFDVAMSWGVNPATVILNGNAVQQYSGANDRFLLPDTGGLLSLMFSGEQGWFDVSKYDISLHPIWYESAPGSGGRAITKSEFMDGKKFVEVYAESGNSGVYTAPEDGYYIVSACGSGGYHNASTSYSGKGSVVRINGDSLFTSLGGSGSDGFIAYTYLNANWGRSSFATPSIISINAIFGGFSILDDTLTSLSSSINHCVHFGISPLQSTGRRTSTSEYHGGPALGSSLLLFLSKGSEVSFALGAKAHNSGSPASSRVYQLQDI